MVVSNEEREAMARMMAIMNGETPPAPSNYSTAASVNEGVELAGPGAVTQRDINAMADVLNKLNNVTHQVMLESNGDINTKMDIMTSRTDRAVNVGGYKIEIMTKYLRIINLVIVCLAVGYLSSKVTQASVESWYPLIKKPFFNPPNWVFAPVWTMLYIFMGIAAGLIWNEINLKEKEVKQGLKFFVIQLALNALWSYLFFGLQNVFLAAIEVILLLLMIYETYIKFKPINNCWAKITKTIFTSRTIVVIVMITRYDFMKRFI